MPKPPVHGPFGAAVIFVLGVFTASSAAAVDLGFPGQGEAMSLEICSDCHVVSDRQVRVGIVGLPTFREIANDPGKTEIWFRAFMRTPHLEMPNFMLSDQQLDDIIAYIHTLKK